MWKTRLDSEDEVQSSGKSHESFSKVTETIENNHERTGKDYLNLYRLEV